MGVVKLSGIEIEYDDEWSFKNFVNQDLHHLTQIHDVIIYSSQFYWEKPDSNPFPSWAKNLTFIKCNLDNIIIPNDSVVIQCSQKRFESQNDLNDWEIDSDDNPVRPVIYQVFEKLGLDIPHPDDIPEEPVTAPIDLLKIARDNS